MVCLIQKQLYFFDSISNFALTDETGSFCNGVLHSLFTRHNGSISVVYTLFMISNCNDMAAFCEDVCMYIQRSTAYQK